MPGIRGGALLVGQRHDDDVGDFGGVVVGGELCRAADLFVNAANQGLFGLTLLDDGRARLAVQVLLDVGGC